MFAFSSCNKDNSDDNPSGGGSSSSSYPETLDHTKWGWGEPGGSEVINGINSVVVTFYQQNNPMTKPDFSSLIYRGSYTYSAGSGSLTLEDTYTHTPASATISISGSTMTFRINGGTYPLTPRS